MDFNEYVLMEDAVRERLDELRRTAGIDADHQIVDAAEAQRDQDHRAPGTATGQVRAACGELVTASSS